MREQRQKERARDGEERERERSGDCPWAVRGIRIGLK